jgi:hypothetical protein
MVILGMKLSFAGWRHGATAGTGSAAADMGSTAAGTDSTAAGSAGDVVEHGSVHPLAFLGEVSVVHEVLANLVLLLA